MSSAALAAVSGMLCVIAAGCAGPRAPAVTAPAASPAPPAALSEPAAPPDLAYHMRASFWDTLTARDALVAGDLPRAKAAADHLAKTEYAPLLPASWMHWVSQLQQQAGELGIAGGRNTASPVVYSTVVA